MQKSSVLERVAQRYNQLYFTPEAGISETGLYYDVVNCGKITPEFAEKMAEGLTGFSCSDKDTFFTEETPAGKIDILYLYERADFERFLQIMVYRGEPVVIDHDLDIAEINGIINWRKIEKHMHEYFICGGEISSWREELRRFRRNKSNFQDDIIIATNCCYNGLSASDAGYESSVWDRISLKMNIYNSCSRIILRKLFPSMKNVFIEELYSDCIGMLFATDSFDCVLEKKILGILPEFSKERFRFSDYCDDNHRDIKALCSALEKAVHLIKDEITVITENNTGDYYQVLIELEKISGIILERSGLCDF